VLYALVEVTGDRTRSDSATPNWNRGSYAPESDGLFVFMDVFNDQWGIETDTQGVFFLGANPALTSVTAFTNAGIPSLGSFFNADNQDYSTRLMAFKSSGFREGNGINYTYEFALRIEGWGDEWNRALTNGTQVGLEIGIADQGQSFTYLSKTRSDAGREGNSNLPNSERVRNRDWGVVTLSGWDGAAPLAYSSWRADEAIRFWNSKSNPEGSGDGTAPDATGDGSVVWSATSRARMMAARNAYQALKPDASLAQKRAAVLVATLAPDRAILIDTNLNDYNDGAMTDNMILQIAKGVYRALGVNGDTFVKFNNGNYVSKGDPHGAAGAAVEGKYLSDFFFGTRTLTAAEAERLNTDPYALKVSNNKSQSPYDYYWGGFNTITGGRSGISGTDGWYFHELAR
jgi:hypothetical protein